MSSSSDLDQSMHGSSIKVLSDKSKRVKSQGGTKRKTRKPKRDDIFELSWLNESMYDARRITRFRKIEKAILEDLADKFRGELDSNAKQQALFSLLGQVYVQKNFPHHKFDPIYLDTLSDGHREEVIKEMKEFIDGKVKQSYDKYQKKNGIDEKLIKEIKEIFSSDLKHRINHELEKNRKIKIKQGRKGRIKIVELEDTMPDRVAFLEATLKDILRNAPEINIMVMEELHKRILILPKVFRQQLFDRLYISEKGVTDEDRENNIKKYMNRVKEKLKENRIDTIGEWSGRRSIDASVILAFERSQALKKEFQVSLEETKSADEIDDKLMFFTRILSIAKLCDSNFSPTHIFWLSRGAKYFPQKETDSKEEKSLSVAYHFYRFSLSSAVFDTETIFRIAQEVYDTLEQVETELLIQINSNMLQGIQNADPTLFSRLIIHEDENLTSQILLRFVKNKKIDKMDWTVFADFKLLLRKWLSEAFVGNMSPHGASLIWDFLFIHKFHVLQTMNVCLALIHLLRPHFKDATNFKRIQNVMIEGPKVFCIRDLRRVLQHLSKGGSYETIPEAPDVPMVEISPPSAGAERKSMNRRIEAISLDLSESTK